MLVYNFFGGPGSGKSTTAAYIFARLKNKGVKAEMAREVAKDFIWEGREVQLARNQFLISALQYSRLKDLEANGCEIAVCDSPILLALVYANGVFYYRELEILLKKLNAGFANVNIRLERSKPYQKFGRMQDEAQAKVIDSKMYGLTYFDYTVTGDETGQNALFDMLWKDHLYSKEQSLIQAKNLG